MGKGLGDDRPHEDVVLLIERDGNVRDCLAEAIREGGFRVIALNDASRVPEDRDPKADIALLGAHGMNSEERKILSRLRSQRPGEGVPIILLTERLEEQAVRAAVRAGADDVVGPPFTAERIATRISAHLRLTRLWAEDGGHVPRAIDEIRLSECRARSLLLATATIVWASTNDGRVVERNTTWEEFTGQEWEDYRELGWLAAVHQSDEAAVRKAFRDSRDQGTQVMEVEFRLRRSDGGYCYMQFQAVLVRNGTQADSQDWVGIMRDISEERHAEEALRKSEEQLRLIMESSTDFGIFTIDMKGVVTTWNAGAEKLLGYSEDEICGKDFHLIFIPEDVEAGAPHEEMENALKTGRGADQRWHVRKDGSRFWADGLVMPLRTNGGEMRGYLKIIRDFTERKKTEDQLQSLTEDLERRVEERTIQLEESRRRLRSLVVELNRMEQMERHRISAELHDSLAQLLTAARLTLESASRELGDAPAARTIKKAQEITSEASRTTRDLMTELSGPRVLEHDDLIVTLRWVAEKMREQGLSVELTHDEPSIPLERDLLTLLYQSVRELLLNILKHAGVSEASVRTRRLEGKVVIEVSDQGRGFDPDKEIGAPGAEGGFGMLNIQERLRWLGGTMDINSAPGQGARITLCLPLLSEAATQDGSELPTTPARHSKRKSIETGEVIRVLLADDHRMVREGFRSIIEVKPDIEVVGEAADGMEALEKTREVRPDIVIMDVNMPQMNGLDATRRILEEMPDVRIIGLSLHGPDDMSEEIRKAGAVAYISKEEAFDRLCETIRDVATAEKKG